MKITIPRVRTTVQVRNGEYIIWKVYGGKGYGNERMAKKAYSTELAASNKVMKAGNL